MKWRHAFVIGVLLLCGCSDGKESPDHGPLELGAPASCLVDGNEAEVEIDAGAVSNPADIPLTVDAVDLHKPRNITLLDAYLLPGGDQGLAMPAVDATVPEKAKDASMSLRLRLRVYRPAEPASFSGLDVDYHNVEGRFRAISRCP